jgi:hypothetical protein
LTGNGIGGFASQSQKQPTEPYRSNYSGAKNELKSLSNPVSNKKNFKNVNQNIKRNEARAIKVLLEFCKGTGASCTTSIDKSLTAKEHVHGKA